MFAVFAHELNLIFNGPHRQGEVNIILDACQEWLAVMASISDAAPAFRPRWAGVSC